MTLISYLLSSVQLIYIWLIAFLSYIFLLPTTEPSNEAWGLMLSGAFIILLPASLVSLLSGVLQLTRRSVLVITKMQYYIAVLATVLSVAVVGFALYEGLVQDIVSEFIRYGFF